MGMRAVRQLPGEFPSNVGPDRTGARSFLGGSQGGPDCEFLFDQWMSSCDLILALSFINLVHEGQAASKLMLAPP
jgi:hypothetical protein